MSRLCLPVSLYGCAEERWDHAGLTAAVSALAEAYPQWCTTSTIGLSHAGRQIPLLGLGVKPYAGKTALLVVAHLEAERVGGSAVAMRAAELLLRRLECGDEDLRRLFDRHTLWVVPRVNVDGAEHFLNGAAVGFSANLEPDDADRDRRLDEDGLEDLDGDGLITMMRVFDAERADHLPDPADERISIPADPVKGLAPVFYLQSEGIDNDGDGAINEDGPGGVLLNRNFMHGWKPHRDDWGRYPVSAPEARALLKFVLDHQEIAAVLQYGAQDNLLETPGSSARLPSGVVRFLEEEDRPYYSEIGRIFRELSGLDEGAAADPNGSFYGWAYAQFGVPAFAATLWTRPEAGAEESSNGSAEVGAEGDADGGDRADADGRVTEGDDAERPEPLDGEEAAWLAYSDLECDGEGFIPWRPFEHPELGRVEIGGWRAGFKVNPPPSAIQGLAERQVEFWCALLDRLPRVRLDEPRVERLATGLYELKLSVVNDGYLPVATARGEANRRVRPLVVRLGLPKERILEGRPVTRVWNLAGSGGRETLRWVIECTAGESFDGVLYSVKYGECSQTIQIGGGSAAEEVER